MTRSDFLGVLVGVFLSLAMAAIVVMGYSTLVPAPLAVGIVLSAVGIVIGRRLDAWDGPSGLVYFIGVVTFASIAYLTVDSRVSWAISLLLGVGVATAVVFFAITTLEGNESPSARGSA